MPNNQEIIRMHLEEFIRENPGQSWRTLLAYCIGYYTIIDLDILAVVGELQVEGLIE